MALTPTTSLNYTTYFNQERDIYVQNVSGEQVSVTFDLGGNRTEGYLFPPNPDPINLSQRIPFNAIKNSMDLRKMLTRRPPALRLLIDSEFKGYYENYAAENKLLDDAGKPDVEAAIVAAADHHALLQSKTLVLEDKVPEPITKNAAQSEFVTEQEVINPKILHLCHQVSLQLPEQQRMPAAKLMEELRYIIGLKIEDYDYIVSHGTYTSVKKWARTKLEELATAAEKPAKSKKAK